MRKTSLLLVLFVAIALPLKSIAKSEHVLTPKSDVKSQEQTAAAREPAKAEHKEEAKKAEPAHAEHKEEAKKDEKKAEASHHAEAGVAPAKAITWLKNGNKRFIKGNVRRDGATHKDIERLASGQKPHSIILSCSDSRVPPEVVFDQKLGEIFVVRTAGETLDPTSIASIEYAVEHLGSKNIVVMGHSQCGAVKAALSTFGGKDAGSTNLNKLVADIHPRIKQFENKTPSKNYVEEGWANTKGVAADLLKRSSIIAEKVKAGEVKIVSALYHLDEGNVDFEK